jgi:glycosyltransferase involved in cell wall biosynthesis
MNGPTIAVIVPNRNDARYLPRCLKSVFDQKIGPEELLIFDDQSADGSPAVIRSLIAGHSCAQLIVNPVNLGTNGVLNEGLRRVQSDYVLFLAANDFLLPGIFARAKQSLARSPGAAVWSAMAWLVDEEDQPVRLHPSAVIALNDAFFPPKECIKLAHRIGHWFTGTTLIYHVATLRAAGGFDAAYGAPADLITALVVASQGGAAYSPEPFAAIRIHEDSFSARALNDVGGMEAMLERLNARGPVQSPELFNAKFLRHTAWRFRFAVVRASGGAHLSQMGTRASGLKRLALICADRVLPSKSALARVALGYLIMRPFDILPTVWYRFSGWLIVRLRMLAHRRGAP